MDKFPETFNAQFYKPTFDMAQENILSAERLRICNKINDDLTSGREATFEVSRELVDGNHKKLVLEILEKFPDNLHSKHGYTWYRTETAHSPDRKYSIKF